MASSTTLLLGASVTACLLASAVALMCFQCGQYNDGVGSITPCINHTHHHLQECPKREHQFCIKYVSEGSVVRDCVAQCTEKEHWGTKTFCCGDNGCNASNTQQVTSGVVLLLCAAFSMRCRRQ